MKILDYRLVIMDNDGELKSYPFSFGMHQECLDNYAKNRGYDYSSLDYLVSNGYGVFYNGGENMVVAKLPANLNERQLYTLDYIENCLDDVFWLQVTKGLGKDEVNFSYNSDIKKNFSNNVVQSYYKVSNKRK